MHVTGPRPDPVTCSVIGALYVVYLGYTGIYVGILGEPRVAQEERGGM